MTARRISDPRWLVLFVVVALLCAPAAPSAQTPEEAAANAAYAVASTAAIPCHVTVDRSQTFAKATTPYEVTDQRPAGYDVVVRGVHGPQETFESHWLVAGNQVYPENIPAARLARGCHNDDIRPSAVADWHRLTYLDPTTGEIEVGGNSAWSGAREVTPLERYTGTGTRLRDPMQPIWSRRCVKGVQTVRFSRDIFLLGPPGALSMMLVNVSRGVRSWPFASWSIYLNGMRLFTKTKPGTALGHLTPKGLGLVRFGANRIDVVVKKRATGPCNGARMKRQVGLLVSIDGQQEWNLYASRPPAIQRTTPPTSAADFAIPHTIGNDGPSVLLEPVFMASVNMTHTTLTPWVIGPYVSSGGSYSESDPGCRSYQDAGAETWQVACGLAPMMPGQRLNLSVTTMIGPPSGTPPNTPYVIAWNAGWRFGTLSDSVQSFVCSPPAGQTTCSP